MFKKFSQLGRAFMLPIAILPVAGLLLGLGGALTNKSALLAYPFLDQTWLQTILSVMSFAGNAVFSNIALIFAIGLAVGLANGDKGTAGLAGGVSFLVIPQQSVVYYRCSQARMPQLIPVLSAPS